MAVQITRNKTCLEEACRFERFPCLALVKRELVLLIDWWSLFRLTPAAISFNTAQIVETVRNSPVKVSQVYSRWRNGIEHQA